MGIPHLLIILVVVALIFGTKRFTRIDEAWLRSRLHRESGRVPVYSAETTHGKEAEFIRDRLPKRFPAVFLLAAMVIFGAACWWLTR